MSKKQKPNMINPKCQLCGDSGSVYRAYVEKDIGVNRARTLVPCPKCAKANK